MRTKINHLTIDNKKRILFISDIHVNIKLLEKLLKKVNFSKEDYLVILGDMIEKSNDSISMLDYMIELSKKENVFIVMGNCDNVVLNLRGKVDGDLLRYYALKRKKTIINDFASRLGVTIDYDTDMQTLCEKFYENFKSYYDFIEKLPHVLIFNNKLCCCHGGINSLSKIPTEALAVMKYDDFYQKAPSKLEIPVVVGHYPTINYNDKVPVINPIIDLNKNIISIDGGNNLVPWAQLNCLIVSNLNDLQFSYEYVDDYPTYIVLKDLFYENKNLYNITKIPKVIDIIKEIGDFYYAKTLENKYICLKRRNIL